MAGRAGRVPRLSHLRGLGAAYDSLGPAAFLGDTDGDGTGEVLFAAPFTSNGAFEEGKVWVAPGAAGALGAPTWTVEGSRQGVHLGQLAEALGDANGDGFQDLLLGYVGGGRLRAFFGRPAGFRAVPDWSSPALGSFVVSVAGGDIDGDGYPDAFAGLSDIGDGEVVGFRGGPGGFASTPDWTLVHAAVPGVTGFGEGMRVIPDLDGDGYQELAVAASSFQVGNTYPGKVEVFRGGAAGPASVPSWTFVGPEPSDNLGRDLASGDVDGDGLTDLLMSVERNWQTPGLPFDGDGGALVALGVPGGLAPTAAYVLRGPHAQQCWFGHDAVADVDLDGRDDVLFTCIAGSTGVPAATGSIVIGYGGLDTDADGVNDALDCAPTDPSVHPGSDEIGYDGIDGDCAGGDDFDLDADGARALPWGFDEDDLDLDIAFSMAVTGSCAATVGFVVDGASPGAAVEVYRGEYSAQGQYQLPAPHPCRSSGHELHLGGGVLLGSTIADASGHAVLNGVVIPAAECSDIVQAMDLSTCLESGTHGIAP